MSKLLPKLMLAITTGSLLFSSRVYTQGSPTTKKAARVRIRQGPEIERVDPDFAIITWTSNNPGGSPEHYGIVRYGTHPTKLNQTAKSLIRLDPGHSYTIFRVRMDGLKPRTTYYYTVDSTRARWQGQRGEERCQAFHHTLITPKDRDEKHDVWIPALTATLSPHKVRRLIEPGGLVSADVARFPP